MPPEFLLAACFFSVLFNWIILKPFTDKSDNSSAHVSVIRIKSLLSKIFCNSCDTSLLLYFVTNPWIFNRVNRAIALSRLSYRLWYVLLVTWGIKITVRIPSYTHEWPSTRRSKYRSSCSTHCSRRSKPTAMRYLWVCWVHWAMPRYIHRHCSRYSIRLHICKLRSNCRRNHLRIGASRYRTPRLMCILGYARLSLLRLPQVVSYWRKDMHLVLVNR